MDGTEQERELINGPVIVRNVFGQPRVWPDLVKVGGGTLALDPGEEAILPQDPGDVAYLSIKKASQAAAHRAESRIEVPSDPEPAEAIEA